MDDTAARAFLRDRFGDAARVAVMRPGEWSAVYSVDTPDGELVTRFSAFDEDFEKDAYAARYASQMLPVPRILEWGPASDGFYAVAERVAVPTANLVALPDAVDVRIGALVEPLANAVHAVGLARRLVAPAKAVVLGGGTIGVFGLHAARATGIADVRIVEPNADRRAAALSAGARAVHADASELAAERNADLVIDAVGATATRRSALDIVRPGGTIVLLGLHEDETALPFHRVVRDQVALQGSFAYTDTDFAAALDLLTSGRVRLGAISGILPLEAGPEAFASLAEGPTPLLKTFLAAPPP